MNMNITRRNFLTGMTALMVTPSFGYALDSDIETQINEFDKCREDIVYFTEKYLCSGVSEDGSVKHIVLKPWQRKYLTHLQKGKNAFLSSYRCSGKTLMNSAFAVWKKTFSTPCKITYVTPSFKRSLEVEKVINDMTDNLPSWMIVRGKAWMKGLTITFEQELRYIDVGIMKGDVLIFDDVTYYRDETGTVFKSINKSLQSDNGTLNVQYVISDTPNDTTDDFGGYCEYAKTNMRWKDNHRNDDFFQITYDGRNEIYPTI